MNIGRSRLADGEVALWYRQTESLSAADVDRLGQSLSPGERLRRDRFVFERDRRDFTVAHGTLRNALSAYGGLSPEDWRFDDGGFGKPAIAGSQKGHPPLTFNLSHTHGFVACAIGRGVEIGVDAERIDRVAAASDLARRYFARGEIRQLETCSPAEYTVRFLELWTLKEAYIKAVGQGLSLPLDSFAFLFDAASGLQFVSPADSTAWRFLLAAPFSDSRMALAVRSGGPAEDWRIRIHANDSPSALMPIRWSGASPAFALDPAESDLE